MKDTTFGSFPAAKTLIDILNKEGNKKISNKVCSTINKFKNTLNELKSIKNKRVRIQTAILWKVEAISIIEELEVSDEVKRFALNVESAFFTMFMKETLKG
jgi:hypothetical protein